MHILQKKQIAGEEEQYRCALYCLELKLGTCRQHLFHQTVNSGSWLNNDIFETSTSPRGPGTSVCSVNRTMFNRVLRLYKLFVSVVMA